MKTTIAAKGNPITVGLVSTPGRYGQYDRQLAAQAKAFETGGGFTERLYRSQTLLRQGGWRTILAGKKKSVS